MTKRLSFSLMGATVNARYMLRAPLGQGGFADVYRAWDDLDEKEVALKVLHVPEHLSAPAQLAFMRSFQDEAKITRRIFQGQTHVRQVLDMGVAEMGGAVVPWMAMELLEGMTLHESLRRRREAGAPPRSEVEVFAFFKPVISVVAFAHENGVVHRDLKPANIFMANGENGESAPILKVLDFGIAKTLDPDAPETASGNTNTSSAIQMFSFPYGTPEQFAGRKTGKYTDVFALGLMLTELLIDQGPLSNNPDMGECMFAAIDPRERPTPRKRGRDVSQETEAVIAKAVALREADRFPSARELLAAVEGVLLAFEKVSPAAASVASVSTNFSERVPDYKAPAAASGNAPLTGPFSSGPVSTNFSERVPVPAFVPQPTLPGGRQLPVPAPGPVYREPGPVPPPPPLAPMYASVMPMVPVNTGPSALKIILIVMAVLGGLVALVIGLGAVGVYGLRKTISNSKTAEAQLHLNEMGRLAVAAYDRETMPEVLTATPVSSVRKVCPSAKHSVPKSAEDIKSKKYMSSAADWDDPGFKCLQFQINEPQYYMYSYTARGDDAFEGTAQGDLNGDSKLSKFTIRGRYDGSKFTVAPITEEDPTE